jgi:hypothetical protein
MDHIAFVEEAKTEGKVAPFLIGKAVAFDLMEGKDASQIAQVFVRVYGAERRDGRKTALMALIKHMLVDETSTARFLDFVKAVMALIPKKSSKVNFIDTLSLAITQTDVLVGKHKAKIDRVFQTLPWFIEALESLKLPVPILRWYILFVKARNTEDMEKAKAWFLQNFAPMKGKMADTSEDFSVSWTDMSLRRCKTIRWFRQIGIANFKDLWQHVAKSYGRIRHLIRPRGVYRAMAMAFGIRDNGSFPMRFFLHEDEKLKQVFIGSNEYFAFSCDNATSVMAKSGNTAIVRINGEQYIMRFIDDYVHLKAMKQHNEDPNVDLISEMF